MQYLSIRAWQADALFASALQRSDEPDVSQVRRAIAAAIRTFGSPGCAQRVAQEFGDHPDTAVVRMRWARIMASKAYADSAPSPLRTRRPLAISAGRKLSSRESGASNRPART